MIQNKDHETRNRVKVAGNFIKLLVHIYSYHAEKSRRTQPAAERAFQLLTDIRNYLFEACLNYILETHQCMSAPVTKYFFGIREIKLDIKY